MADHNDATQELPAAAPPGGCGPIIIPIAALVIGAAVLVLPDPPPSDNAHLSVNLLALLLGLLVMHIGVSGVPLPPAKVELLTIAAVGASIAALLLTPPPAGLRLKGIPEVVQDYVPAFPGSLDATHDPVACCLQLLSAEAVRDPVAGGVEVSIANDLAVPEDLVAGCLEFPLVNDLLMASALADGTACSLSGKTKSCRRAL